MRRAFKKAIIFGVNAPRLLGAIHRYTRVWERLGTVRLSLRNEDGGVHISGGREAARDDLSSIGDEIGFEQIQVRSRRD
jgi:hypothetical protein